MGQPFYSVLENIVCLSEPIPQDIFKKSSLYWVGKFQNQVPDPSVQELLLNNKKKGGVGV